MTRQTDRPGGLRILGYLGVVIALPFFVWLPLGFLKSVPSLVDVFGVPGLRIPAAFTVAGLLIAAIGFWDS
jgi:hypothetical protein